MQLAWGESKIIPTENTLLISQELEEVGRMLGGWRKGLIGKQNPPHNKERKIRFGITMMPVLELFQTLSFENRHAHKLETIGIDARSRSRQRYDVV
jgi:hypothetical protein